MPRRLFPKMNENARYGFLVAGGLAFALVVGGGTWLALRYVDAHGLGGARPMQRQKKEFRKVLAEDLRVTRHGVPGVDFLRCGTCRLEKRKKGPLTLGGLNVLVLEDLSVVLPPEDPVSAGGAKGAAVPDSSRRSDARSIVRRFGVTDGFLANRGLPVRFSGLKISNLSVSSLVAGNSTQPLFKASSGEGVRGGLALKGCVVYRSSGEGMPVGKALLTQSGGKLRLKWRDGEMELK